jgi:predicted metalloprotease with PDZ domain
MWMAPIALALSTVVAAAASEPRIRYRVGLGHAKNQIVEVTASAGGIAPGATHVDFVMPAWRPGRYQILDLAGAVREVSARSGAGADLPWEKVDKSTWRVQTDGSGAAELRYRVYCNALGERTRHADETHAFLSGAAAFVYVDGRTAEPVEVRFALPEGWRLATGLPAEAGRDDTLLAPSYDVLVDSPIEAGVHETLSFDVDGVPHEIAIWGRAGEQRAKAPEDFAKIVREQRKVFGDLPYSRYVYLVHSYPGGSGGTEHLNSTVLQTSPASFETPEAYRRFLGLVSHEMFHTWNVKHLRPAGLKPYDYVRENYTDLLWVAEGTTSYYGALTLVRAGFTKPDDYLSSLAGGISALRKRPGRLVQSVAESSFDAWIKFNKPSPDSVNTTVSFYDKGSLVSLLLDLEIRARSEGRASLDTVMADLYRQFPLDGPGYTSDDFRAAAERAAGAGGGAADLRAFFERYVNGTAEPDWDRAFAPLGVEVVSDKPKKRRGAKADQGDTPESDGPAPSLGLTLRDEGGLAVVATVLDDGPAADAGVIAGDGIVALDGLRLRAGDLDANLKRYKPGATAKLSLFRYDQLHEKTLTIGTAPPGDWRLERVRSPTDEQRALYEGWIAHPWPNSKPAAAKDPESE